VRQTSIDTLDCGRLRLRNCPAIGTG
jgi:hypothetical protein